MVVHLEQVEEPRQPWERTLPVSWLTEHVYAAAPAFKALGEIAFKAALTKLGGNSLLVEGKAIARLASECRRCLTEVKSEIPLVFTLQLVKRPQLKAHDEHERKGKRGRHDGADQKRAEHKSHGRHDEEEDDPDATFDEEDADLEFFDGDHVDLAPIIREQLLLGLPAIEPLCRDACKGLCSTCGQDLNLKDCGHSQKVPDPRLLALKDIKV